MIKTIFGLHQVQLHRTIPSPATRPRQTVFPTERALSLVA
jgi:hypothetical protein